MQPNVMSAARNLTKRVGSKRLLLAAALALLSGSASAQMPGSAARHGAPENQLSPAEQQRQKNRQRLQSCHQKHSRSKAEGSLGRHSADNTDRQEPITPDQCRALSALTEKLQNVMVVTEAPAGSGSMISGEDGKSASAGVGSPKRQSSASQLVIPFDCRPALVGRSLWQSPKNRRSNRSLF
jgi:hypothetical protein